MKSLKVQLRWLRKELHHRNICNRDVFSLAIDPSIQRIYWTAPALVVGNFLAAVGFLMQPIPQDPVAFLWRESIIKTNFIISFLSLMIWFGTLNIRKNKVKEKTKITFLYGVVTYVLAVGIILSTIDQLVLVGITPILICTTLVGTFYYIPPRNAILIYGVSFLAFFCSMVYILDLPDSIMASNVINGLVVHALGFSLSSATWRSFRTSKLQEKTIAKQQALLEQMAYHDPLTKLPNRRLLDELVKREVALIERGHPRACLLLVDIDGFKQINDTFGHPIGDEILRKFAQVLGQHMRGSNTLTRLGGEEFLILAPQTSLDEGQALAERLRITIEKHPFKVCDRVVHITASFGVAELQGNEHARNYYVKADKALYQAKQTGKNRVVAFRVQPTRLIKDM